MNNIKEIVSEEEFASVIKSEKPVVVDFFAKWCGPCKMQQPILKEFCEEIGERAHVIKVDVDQNPALANAYQINSIPTLVIFKNGEMKEKMVGLTTKANLSEKLIKYL